MTKRSTLKISSILLIFTILFVVGCGGGTAGTGKPPTERTLTITGMTTSQTGEPLDGIILRSSTDQVEVATSSEGTFEMMTLHPDGSPFALEISSSGAESRSLAIPVESNDKSLNLSITIITASEGIEIVDVTVTSRENRPSNIVSTLENNQTAAETNNVAVESTEELTPQSTPNQQSALQTDDDSVNSTKESSKSNQTIFKGTILYGNEPLRNAQISIPQITAKTVKSDRNGKWEIRTKPPTDSTIIYVRVRALELDGNITIANPPRAPSVISMTLRFPNPSNTTVSRLPSLPLELVSIRYRRR